MSQTLLIITEPSAFHPIMITKWYKFLSLIHNLYKRKNTKHAPCRSNSWIPISGKVSVFKPNLLPYPNLLLNTSIINETKKLKKKKTPIGPLQMISDQSFLPLPMQNSGSFLKAWRFTHGEECCLCRGIKMC